MRIELAPATVPVAGRLNRGAIQIYSCYSSYLLLSSKTVINTLLLIKIIANQFNWATINHPIPNLIISLK